jgi:hypothetical protein
MKKGLCPEANSPVRTRREMSRFGVSKVTKSVDSSCYGRSLHWPPEVNCGGQQNCSQPALQHAPRPCYNHKIE